MSTLDVTLVATSMYLSTKSMKRRKTKKKNGNKRRESVYVMFGCSIKREKEEKTWEKRQRKIRGG